MIEAISFIKSPRLYRKLLLKGEEEYFIERIIGIYREKLSQHQYITFEAKKDDWNEMVTPLFSGAIFSKGYLLVIYGFDDLKRSEVKTWIERLKKIPRNTYLLGVVKSGVIENELEEFFEKEGVIVNCSPVKNPVTILMATFKKEGIEFSREDIELLLDISQGLLMNVKTEVDKIKLVKDEIGRGLEIGEIIGGKIFANVRELQRAFENKEKLNYIRSLLTLQGYNFRMESIIPVLFGTCLFLMKGRSSKWDKEELVKVIKFLFMLEKEQRKGITRRITEKLIYFPYNTSGWQ